MWFDLGGYDAIIGVTLIGGVFLCFMLEVKTTEVIAFSGAAVALVLGLVSTDDILKAVSNPAPVTIAAMFVLSAALVRTGLLTAASDLMKVQILHRPALTICTFFLATAIASAFMNNTPVVMVLIPVVITMAKELKLGASRLLIPLSYMVILGGTCTLIGTSTNLLVDGLAQKLGQPAFDLFEIAPVGLVVVLVGGLFLLIFGPHLLKDRPNTADLLTGRPERSWLVELFIPSGSPLVNRLVNEVTEFKRGEGRVLDLVRGDQSFRHLLTTERLQAGDTVVIKTTNAEVMGFRDGLSNGVSIGGTEAASARKSLVAEVLIGPNSQSVGKTLADLRWRRRYGVYPMALHRNGNQVDIRLVDVELGVGDTLMLDGAPEDLLKLADDQGLIPVSQMSTRGYRRSKAPLAMAILVSVVGLAALNIAPILPLALVGVAIAILTRCLDIEEALEAIDGRLLLLIVSMITLGTALENSGALALLVGLITPWLQTMSPLMALALVYIFTSILTEMVTNNAVAVLMVPIAVGISNQLGLDPRAFLVAVMFAASASFATPIGYQTNTLVYNAGGYRFSDFLRIGIPMNIIVGATTIFMIPLIWPL